MKKTVIALCAALLATTANADTLISNVVVLQTDANGKLAGYAGLLIGDDGKVKQLLLTPDDRVGHFDREIDGHGRFLLPGFIDAHGHVTDLGFAALHLDLTGSKSLVELQRRLHDYAAAHPKDRWLIGFGWNQELWPQNKFPTAADLDAVVPDRPVVLERVDGHAVVANTAALKAAGVTAATKAPPGGEIQNGLFVDTARGLIDNAIPKPTQAQMDEAFAKSQEILLGFGVTGVGSMSTSLDDWNAFRRSGESGRLNVRLMVYLLGLDPLKAVPHPTDWMYNDRLRAVGVKFFADGALGSRGAWLKRPYADKPDTTGNQLHTDAELRSQEDRKSVV